VAQVEPIGPDTKPGPLSTIYLITVVVLGLTVLSAVVGAIWLTLAAQEIPALLVSLGSAAIGALAGLMAPTSEGGS
jgi:hypothetical protein